MAATNLELGIQDGISRKPEPQVPKQYSIAHAKAKIKIYINWKNQLMKTSHQKHKTLKYGEKSVLFCSSRIRIFD